MYLLCRQQFSPGFLPPWIILPFRCVACRSPFTPNFGPTQNQVRSMEHDLVQDSINEENVDNMSMTKRDWDKPSILDNRPNSTMRWKPDTIKASPVSDSTSELLIEMGLVVFNNSVERLFQDKAAKELFAPQDWDNMPDYTWKFKRTQFRKLLVAYGQALLVPK